jgi:hypothetical protein
MRKFIISCASTISFLVLNNGCGTDYVGTNFSPAFTEYSTIQFITSKGPDPSSAMRMDNNGDILLACREGATTEELEAAGIHVTSSQLRLLEILRLLDKGEEYRTAFPILDSVQTTELRGLMDGPARELATLIGPALNSLLKLIAVSYPESNSSFSIAFTYVLDGMVWEVMEAQGLTKPRKITIEEPLWGGEIWSIYPPRPFSSGTNSFWDEGVVFAVNWSRGIMPKLRKFWADRSMLDALFNEFHNHGSVVDSEVLEYYLPMGIIDEDGNFTIPIILEGEGNELYDRCMTISEQLVEAIPQMLDLRQIMEQFAFSNISQTTIISYHELMWSITEQLEADGLVSRPIAFTDPDNARMEDLADLILILK